MSDTQETKGDVPLGKLTDVDVVVKDAFPPSELSQVPSCEGDSVVAAPPVLTAREEARLWRKIDWHIMPILTMMYLFSFVDRGNIGASLSCAFYYPSALGLPLSPQEMRSSKDSSPSST